ncbi:MAG: dihydroorotate dehydrogenase [Bacillota bacterium]|jgi:dihydroorotate dehydrogenase (NAD+) catalytic subunit
MGKVDLSVDVAGIKMKNPITTASGTFGFGKEYGEYFDLSNLGAITVKGTTLEARIGNPPPRLVETCGGILNAVGLENPGVDTFLNEALPFLSHFDLPVIVNIAGHSVEEYGEVAKRLNRKGISALEVNISCPNVKNGGLAFGTDPDMAGEVIRVVKTSTDIPVIAKLSPNVTDIVQIAKAVQKAGADALSLINTILGMSIDINQRKPILGNSMGGLSGPSVKPVAVRMIWQVSQAVDLPIIGMGGVVTWEDAVELILAGATAIAVGTANFVNPLATMEIIEGIRKYLEINNFSSVNEIIGLSWK